MQEKKTVFVGLSGGVDSSVAALRLKKEGYTVVGVFIRVWQPDFLNCAWEDERLDAMRVAAHLDIPFLMCDARDAYKKDVADYFIQAYKNGITPNPDVMCNKEVKFGAFLDFALAHNADFIATGHYAQRGEGAEGITLLRGVDTNKDQSYFLWTLTQAQLAKVLLPVGKSSKDLIRNEAQRAGIPVALKKDSQGVCFLGHIDIPDFLSHYIDLQEGQLLNKAGQTIGTHKGAFVYTLGQRHGFTVTDKNNAAQTHYVTAKNIGENTVTVTTEKQDRLEKETITVHSTNWTSKAPSSGAKVEVQTRYRQAPIEGTVVEINDDIVTVALETAHEITAPGQSCVLYVDDLCLGGGIIAE
jgi:tRNA-specific 2-thiouridylase